jgi:hypothetical protein
MTPAPRAFGTDSRSGHLGGRRPDVVPPIECHISLLYPCHPRPVNAYLRRIAQEEPIAPGRLDPGIRRELETILLKAMAKAPGTRYATAQDLADDLGRFLEDRPIRARRPTVWERVVKWARRPPKALRWPEFMRDRVILLEASRLTRPLTSVFARC